MKLRLRILLFTFCSLVLNVQAQCDALEYLIFNDSQSIPVPPDVPGDVENCYSITQNLPSQTGAIWSTETVNLNSAFNYSYYLNMGDDDVGADGMIFVLNGDPLGQAAIGEFGGFLGYGGVTAISPSLGIECDTWDNGVAVGDIFNDHMMLHYNGVMNPNSVDAIDLGNVEDGLYHLVQVDWNPVAMNLSVFFDGVELIDEDVDLVNAIFTGNPEVLIGFVGSTGGFFNDQIICDIQVLYTEICNGIDDDCDGLIDEDIDSYVEQEFTICEGEIVNVGPSEYGTDGVYEDILTNVFGCDSVIQTTLFVLEKYEESFNAVICNGETYTTPQGAYTSDGIYEENYPAANGCDSTVTIFLDVIDAYATEQTRYICEGTSLEVGTSAYTEPGTYVDVLASISGCDSAVTTYLDVISELNITDSILCEGEVYNLDLGEVPVGIITGYTSVNDGVYTYDHTGVFYAQINLDNCDLDDSFKLSFIPIRFNQSYNRILCTDEELVLEGRNINFDYVWNTGETDSVITVFEEGLYIKEYDYPCGTFQDVFAVEEIECECFVYLPNSFTPNADGRNDQFGVQGKCEFSSFDFKIYDRDGLVVFETVDPEALWSGNVDGYYVADGAYTWVLNYAPRERSIGNSTIKRGSVLLIR